MNAANNLNMNCNPVSTSKYVEVPYRMTQFYRITVISFGKNTVVTGMTLVTFVYWSVNTIAC